MDPDDLKAERLRLHRLSPSRPIRTLAGAVAFIQDRGLVLSTGRSSLPMLAEAIAGRPLAGSWMAHPEAHRIYRLLGRLARHADVLTLPLVLGKETLVHASLGPAIARIAADPRRRDEAVSRLTLTAKRLLTDVESRGEVRMDQWEVATAAGRQARYLLERELLVTSTGLHTARGYHTAIVRPWIQSRIAQRFGGPAVRLDYAEAMDALVLAALRSAVLAPEREVRRWFVFAAGSLDGLLASGTVERLRAGRVTWLTFREGQRRRAVTGRAGRARRG